MRKILVSLVIVFALGLAAQAQMRAEGRNPSHGGEARNRQSASAAKRRAEQAAWGGESRDPEEFGELILPGLRSVPLATIAAATGLSVSYAHAIRRGARVPHPRWWPALKELTTRPTVP